MKYFEKKLAMKSLTLPSLSLFPFLYPITVFLSVSFFSYTLSFLKPEDLVFSSH